MRRARVHFLIVLVLLTLSLSGCGLFRQSEKPEVDLAEIFPENLPVTGQVKRLDVNGEGKSEWLVFYHMDLVEGDKEDSPTAVAVYRPVADPDSRLPPHLVPALLWLPEQGYPCFYTCEADMQDVISEGSQGKELVIQDKREDETVGVAIFRWQEGLVVEADDGSEGGFVLLGHFRADSVTVKKDEVEVIREAGDRSDLATREVYKPQAGHYYLDRAISVGESRAQLRSPEEAEVIFASGSPEEPASVKLPEKLVMSFYQNYGDLDEIGKYLSIIAQDEIASGCPAEACGCVSEWKDVSRVIVKQIAYEAEDKAGVSVVVRVLCINKNDQPDPLRTVTWRVMRQSDGTWRLLSVRPGGDEYLKHTLAVNH
jgi:hypothetical protein